MFIKAFKHAQNQNDVLKSVTTDSSLSLQRSIMALCALQPQHFLPCFLVVLTFIYLIAYTLQDE